MTQARGVMGQLLRSTYVETAYNYDPASMACYKLPFNTCELRGDQTLTTPATITGRRDPAEPIGGNVNVAGSIVVPLDRHNIGHWQEDGPGCIDHNFNRWRPVPACFQGKFSAGQLCH